MFVQLPGSERLLNLAMVREIKITQDSCEGYDVIAVDLLGKNKTIKMCKDIDEAWNVCSNIGHKMADRGLIIDI